MDKFRLLELLANALEYIEEMTNENIMNGDVADAIGITSEEYDEIMGY